MNERGLTSFFSLWLDPEHYPLGEGIVHAMGRNQFGR